MITFHLLKLSFKKSNNHTQEISSTTLEAPVHWWTLQTGGKVESISPLSPLPSLYELLLYYERQRSKKGYMIYDNYKFHLLYSSRMSFSAF